MSSLEDLANLSVKEKQALGISATVGEIAQQPKTWRLTRQIFEDHQEQFCEFLERAGVCDSIERRPTVILVGAGSSDYIGQSLTLLLREQWGCETLAVASTDLLSNMADYVVPGRRYLWISFSRSGDSPEGVAVLSQALEDLPEVSHLVITCNEQGRMIEISRNSDRVCGAVLDDVVNDRGLAMTSSFSNMVVFGQCLAHAWSPESYAGIFEQLVQAGEKFLPNAAGCAEELAKSMPQRVCIVGSGALLAVAKESALKVLEMTAGRVTTMSESVMGLRHGPMAALNAETLFVCFASNDRRRQRYEADLLREVGRKEIVASTISVGPAAADEVAAVSDQFLSVNGDVPDLYRPPIDVIFGQTMGLYFSMAHRLKPDSPSPDGVISRVVQEFSIYR